MKIISWNVNGIRAATRKGFADWLSGCDADVVCIQEVRARRAQVPRELSDLPGWSFHLVEAERPGYSGVGVFARRPPDTVTDRLDRPELDAEGRYQELHVGDLIIANAYFPNGNGSAETYLTQTGKTATRRSNDRVPYKLAFYRAVRQRLQDTANSGRPVLVLGDFNTAHRPIDLARPKDNKNTSGFLPEERAELDTWLAAGWTDTFRHRHGEVQGAFSWWSQRGTCRARNVGWRLDMVLASPAALARVQDAFILPNVTGSDHCPVGVTLAD